MATSSNTAVRSSELVEAKIGTPRLGVSLGGGKTREVGRVVGGVALLMKLSVVRRYNASIFVRPLEDAPVAGTRTFRGMSGMRNRRNRCAYLPVSEFIRGSGSTIHQVCLPVKVSLVEREERCGKVEPDMAH